jgi:peptidoglycan/LPS O-acetylase OafA/YrhL
VNSSGNYRPDIDGLRAIAVLTVVGFHAFPAIVAGGFIGVDVFFVISGYLISRNIQSQLGGERFTFADFYARRICRIFPALIAVLAATYAIGWAFLFANEFEQLNKHLAGGGAFVSNLVLHQEAGYFDVSKHTKPLLHLWSLGVEEQFYVVWPLLLWLAWLLFRGSIWPVAVLSAASLLASLVVTARDAGDAFYLPMFRVWEFGCGALLALAAPPPRAPAVRDAMAAAGMLLITAVSLTTIAPEQFPGWWAVLPVLGAALIIAAGPDGGISRHLLSQRALVWIGLISYPLYLWHWPLLVFARILDGPLPSRQVRVALIAASVALAWMTYRYLERPIRRHPTRRVAVALVMAMALVAVAGYLTYANDGLPDRPVARRTQPYIDSIHYTPRLAECFDIAGAGSAAARWFCDLHAAGAPARAMLFGDSHALALLPAFEAAAAEQDRNILMTGYSGCPPLLGVSTVRGGLDCRALSERVFRFVVERGITDLFLSGLWTYYTDGDYAGENFSLITTGDTPPTLEGSRAAFERAVQQTVARYAATNVRLHFIQKAPTQRRLATDLVREIASRGDSGAAAIDRVSVTRADHRRLTAFVSSAFERAGITPNGPKAYLLDLESTFCGAAVCPFAAPGTSFYIDHGHLSVAGALRAVPVLSARLRQLAAEQP